MQCADYEEENGRAWSPDKCRGWPRAYGVDFQYSGYGFGADAGYNYQPSDAQPCKSTPAAGDYTATYPQATYSPGQRVCLAWPPKNHVAATCNNPNIQDHGTRIYRSGLNPTSDPTLDQFHTNLVYDFGVNTGTSGIGFQNCPEFCTNPDKCLCTGCFVIPTNLALGKYTFLWEWAFNSDADVYTTCFDVSIVGNTGNYVKATYTHESADQYKALLASGAVDTPTINSGGGSDKGASSGGGSSSGSGTANDIPSSGGMSTAGKAFLAIFIIGVVGMVVGSFLFVKLGYGTIDTKYPFYHKKAGSNQSVDGRSNVNYVAFVENS